MSNNIEIDKKELVKQMQKDILKGNHVELRIIVGEDSNDPMVIFNNKGTSYREVGLVYLALEETKKVMEKRYPLEVRFAKEKLNLEGSTEIEMKD